MEYAGRIKETRAPTDFTGRTAGRCNALQSGSETTITGKGKIDQPRAQQEKWDAMNNPLETAMMFALYALLLVGVLTAGQRVLPEATATLSQRLVDAANAR